MSSYLLYFFRREGKRVPPRFLRRAAPLRPRVSSAGGMSSLFEVSFRRSKVRRFGSFDSLCGPRSPSVFSSGRHPFLLKFSRVGGKSTSLGLLEWAASRPPPVFSSGRHVCPSRFLRRRWERLFRPHVDGTSENFRAFEVAIGSPKVRPTHRKVRPLRASNFGSTDRKLDQLFKRSGSRKFQTFGLSI